ncbi:low temperature requirement protein A [Latilactobacillus sakei]
MKPKKVELTELFYDLVFVYAISKITEILHHTTTTHFGIEFTLFVVLMIVFINTWMVQTVYTNRYGRNSIPNLLFFMVDMGIILFMSSNIEPSLEAFRPVVMAAGLLTVTLVLQYWLTNRQTTDPINRQINQIFIYILSLRASLLLTATILPLRYGLIVAVIAILSGWILPAVFTNRMKDRPINFPHLLERLTALSIIAFGEVIINIAPYFELKKVTLFSGLIFVTICMLFMTYITQFDHWIDEHRENESGVRLIYLHYPILFGISLVTIGFRFINDSHFDALFANCLLYAGIAVFYLGIFLSDAYNKRQLQKKPIVLVTHIITMVIGLGVCVVFRRFEITVAVTALMTFSNAFMSAYTMVQQSRVLDK